MASLLNQTHIKGGSKLIEPFQVLIFDGLSRVKDADIGRYGRLFMAEWLDDELDVLNVGMMPESEVGCLHSPFHRRDPDFLDWDGGGMLGCL